MDSGASFLASPYKDLMKNFKTRNFGKVRLVDDEALEIAGMGDINLRTSIDTIWTLKDVIYIPRLKKMLISIDILDVQGYRVTFSDDQWKVVKGNLFVVHVWKKGTLYMVELPTKEVNSVSNDVGHSSTLWHQRLGHMSKKGMKILVSKGTIPELKDVQVSFYEPCVFGK
uniref:Retrovirus-related Pol polyprotein from transposon TNT 1-94 n=1 Tax=Cajanus cajan TaxID=3821 RepID=A0A151RBC5_CAJCA|nr:Retrovirus-related Pol polyprotein from transposon TNT 1-94 [Cajanus cajan]